MNKTLVIDAAPEVVWTFLTEADKLGSWLHRADRDLAIGTEYTLRGEGSDGRTVRKCWGRVLEMDPPRRLVYSFTVAPLEGRMTTVMWELEAIPGGTRLTLTHEGLEGDTIPSGLHDALDAGWDRHLEALHAGVPSDTATASST